MQVYASGGLYEVVRELFKVVDHATAFLNASLVNDTTAPFSTVTTLSSGMDNKTSTAYQVTRAGSSPP